MKCLDGSQQRAREPPASPARFTACGANNLFESENISALFPIDDSGVALHPFIEENICLGQTARHPHKGAARTRPGQVLQNVLKQSALANCVRMFGIEI